MKIPENAPFDSVQDDIAVYRFLSGKKWVYKDAVDQYQAMLKFRKDDDVDNVEEWIKANREKVDLIEALYPQTQRGFDREGRPISIQKFGRIPAKRFVKLVSVEDHRKYHIHQMEKLMKACRDQTLKLGRPVYKTIAIVDLEGIAMEARYFYPFLKDMASMDNQNYPEFIHRVFCINAPWIFPTLYSLAKPLLDPTTKQKIQVIPAKPIKVLEALKQDIDMDVINVKYGGQDATPLPELRGVELKESHEHDKTERKLQSGEAIQITEELNDAKGGRVMWGYHMESHDVTFGAEWKGKREKKASVLIDSDAPKELESHGSHGVKTAGILTIKFTNTSNEARLVKFTTMAYSATLLDTNRAINETKAKEKAAKERAEKVRERAEKRKAEKAEKAKAKAK